jgi:hypothetical protein
MASSEAAKFIGSWSYAIAIFCCDFVLLIARTFGGTFCMGIGLWL